MTMENRRMVLRARAGSRKGSFRGCNPSKRDENGHFQEVVTEKKRRRVEPTKSPLEGCFKGRGWRCSQKLAAAALEDSPQSEGLATPPSLFLCTKEPRGAPSLRRNRTRSHHL
eukprot:TRINITY_DN1901_c0_g1_i3.p1 TRINITY_DN1901_c0_g1~~TRINITY_DN1901_c0_g1_i3.p1  ORF type:complete len:113 (+),score=17.13 TRINITY_DN1901_c0_g1_i3:67-405(+)